MLGVALDPRPRPTRGWRSCVASNSSAIAGTRRACTAKQASASIPRNGWGGMAISARCWRMPASCSRRFRTLREAVPQEIVLIPADVGSRPRALASLGGEYLNRCRRTFYGDVGSALPRGNQRHSFAMQAIDRDDASGSLRDLVLAGRSEWMSFTT